MHEIPKHEYSVAMSQISMWSDALVIRDHVKEARERYETEQAALDGIERPADRDDK